MREATSASPGRPVLANAPVCGCTFILRRLNTSLHRFPQLRSPSGQLLPPKLICIPSKMVCIAAAPATRATSHAPRLAAAGPAAHRQGGAARRHRRRRHRQEDPESTEHHQGAGQQGGQGGAEEAVAELRQPGHAGNSHPARRTAPPTARTHPTACTRLAPSLLSRSPRWSTATAGARCATWTARSTRWVLRAGVPSVRRLPRMHAPTQAPPTPPRALGR